METVNLNAAAPGSGSNGMVTKTLGFVMSYYATFH
jgi:hypothetical protein